MGDARANASLGDRQLTVLKTAFLALAAAAAMAAPPAPAAQPAAGQAARDWSRTVVETPDGGFRMGNPDARVKLVEYVSLTCPHCAQFARESGPSLVRDHVRTGKVSVEYRNFVLNGVDLVATLLARCGGPSRFVPLSEAMLASQPEWVGKLTRLTDAEKTQIDALGREAKLIRLAQASGLDTIAARHGVPASEARTCLSDPARLDRLAGMFQAGSALGVEGTPTFLINGSKVAATDWASLQPLLKAAGG